MLTYGSVRGVPGNRHPYRDHIHVALPFDEPIGYRSDACFAAERQALGVA